MTEKFTRQDIANELILLAKKVAPDGEPGPGPDPGPKPDKQKAIIDRDLNGQGDVILQACKSTGLSVSDACALVQQESGGRNIFGHDWGDTGDNPPFSGHPVTPERVQRLINQPGYYTGTGKMNGVGLTQLTWYTFVLEAQKLGGAHIPLIQCRVGFRLMNTYLHKYPRERAFACYNAGDSANWINGRAYAREVMTLSEQWKRKLALDPDVEHGLLSHGVTDGTNFAKGYKAALQLLGRDYWIWSSGVVPSGEGMYAINRPLPPLNQIGRINCTGLGNILRRVAGKIIPTRGNELYDGGVAAYFYSPASFPGVGVLGPGFFSGVDVPFDMTTAKKWAKETGSGVALGRSYENNTLAGQGHFAVLLPDGMVLQSITLGGVNINYTIEQSNGNGYYRLMIHPDDWINHTKNDF